MLSHCKNRWSASAIHFLASLSIFLIFIFVLLKLWYPAPFFSASGGWQGLKIVSLIDLVLGPLLTLIIYNKKKSIFELRIDLGLIVLIQLSALIWGITTIYEQRPVAAAFWEGRFYTVPAYAIQDQKIQLNILDQYGSEKPVYVYVDRPISEDNWKPVLDKIYQQKTAPHHQTDLYRPIANHFEDIFKYEVDIAGITSLNQDMKHQLDKIFESSNTSLNDNHYIALDSKYKNIILIYDVNGTRIGTLTSPLKKPK